ncbi:MAG: hypothetical protein U0Z44_19980 [Kouleothrix sp.]
MSYPLSTIFPAAHRPTHSELEAAHTRSQHTIAAWRTALAQRWNAEVAGRRLHKRIVRELIAYYGSESAPEIQLLSRGGAEADKVMPNGFSLADPRRLQAALAINLGRARSRRAPGRARPDVALGRAIEAANRCETQRRSAVLDQRMAGEAYRRIRTEARRKLRAHYGDHLLDLFGDPPNSAADTAQAHGRALARALASQWPAPRPAASWRVA